MAPLLRALGRQSRLAPLLVGLVVLSLTVAGVVWAKLSWSDEHPVTFPAGQNTAAPAGIVPSTAPDPRPASRPNIVMVLGDDMRTDDLRWMPNVRRLVEARGLQFRNSFSGYPLCAPARASLLTGQYAHNNGVLGLVRPYGFAALDDRRTLATSLNAAGYNTLFVGKYVNGYGVDTAKATGQASFRYVPPGWTEWRASVNRPSGSGYPSGGTYDYFDMLVNANGRINDSYQGRYQTGAQERIAAGLLRTYHRSPKPFFLSWAPIAPHVGKPRESDDPTGLRWPRSGRPERIKTPARPRRVWGRFDSRIRRASGLPADGGPAEANVRDKPRPMRNLPELSPAERTAVRTLTRQRAEALFVLDQQVGRLVATLKRTGDYKNTVIMFTSDNGYFLGEHRIRQGKTKPQEPSLRVPFLMAGPGIPRGTRFDPVSSVDVPATILDIAGAKPPRPPDGVSVLPSVKADRGWRVPLLLEGLQLSKAFSKARASPAPGFEDPRTDIGLRTPRWKYVRYVNGDGELYDLDRDPNELTNLYRDPRYARVRAELARLWWARKDCAGVSCRAPMPRNLQRGPAANRAATVQQSREVAARYGYLR